MQNNHRLKPELGKVRGLGSGKNGTHHWIMQRMTAAALVPLFLFMIYLVLSLVGADYVTAMGLISTPINAILTILFIIVGFYHAQLGLQVVIEDYVHSSIAKISLIWGVKIITIGLMSIGVFSILQIAL